MRSFVRTAVFLAGFGSAGAAVAQPPAKLPETQLPVAPPPAIPKAANPGVDTPGLPMPNPTPANAPGAPGCSACTSLADAVYDPNCYLFDQSDRLRLRGWANGGYIYNPSNPASRFNGPYNATDRSNEPMFNQAYAIAELVLPQDGSFGFGARADVLYGFDFNLAQSVGFETRPNGGTKWNSSQYYGLALPQAYGEVGTEQLSMKVGHFYSILGYEQIPAVNNFFYSHSYSFQFGQPFTFWGGLATAKLTSNWQVQAGLTNGWNTLDGPSDFLNVIGGVKYTPDCQWFWTSFTFTAGKNPSNPGGVVDVPNTYGYRGMYNWLFGLTLTPRLEYVFNYTFGIQENGTAGGDAARWYGIDNYFYFRCSDSLKVGTRVEWFRDEDGTRVGLNRPANPNKVPLPGSYYAVTFGANYTPVSNVMFRPEIRCDWATDTVRDPYTDGRRQYQLTLGGDLIFRF